jgi:6,7-dimethyl-8-ribityllumazine synthase
MSQVREVEGRLEARPGDRFAIVASRFNQVVVRGLIEGAIEGFASVGVGLDDLVVVHVPGALEIPFAVRRLLAKDSLAGIVALGAVIRGETGHYDIVARESAGQLARLAAEASIPVLNGILTVDDLSQGLERAGGKAGNKGTEVALAAVRRADLARRLEQE